MAVRGLHLMSGGLDSMLAAKVLKEQGIEVVGISFSSLFFGAGKARIAADELGIELMVKDITKEHLALIKNPPHGYGKNMNPCIDCHAMMLINAHEIMKVDGFDFVSTGEVLGQRPMSQNIDALKIVEKESNLKGYLIRPMSAKLLDITVPESDGRVNREMLLDISGRSRKPQMDLAVKFGITSYQTPAGGCLLTDPGFSKRLRDLFEYNNECSERDVKLLRYGRHFRLPSGSKIVVGRNEMDNKEIVGLSIPSDHLIQPDVIAGPICILVQSCDNPEDFEFLCKLCAAYSDLFDGNADFIYRHDGKEEKVSLQKLDRSTFSKLLIGTSKNPL